jgi:ATP-binding cassette subfamily B (MDR/TAP) protein 1
MKKAFAGVGFGIIYSSTLNFKLTLLMCAFIPVAIISGLISGKDPNANSNRINSFEESGRLTTETVENIKTIISLGRENHFVKEFKSLFNKTIKKVFLMIHVSGIFYSLSQSVIFFIQSAAYGYGWILIRDEKLEITSLYQIYACLAFSSITLGRVYSQMPDQKNAKYGARTAFRIIERKSKIDSMSDEGLKPDDVYGEIKFENVHFQYPNRPDIKILNGFNLVCKKGQTNALVGPSGCGKSTTIALLLRFYDVDAGTVYLDGRDIRTLNVNWLRSKIALVSQEPTLFNLSIFENVCYGDITREKIPINEVMGACRESNINNRIEKLPDVIFSN